MLPSHRFAVLRHQVPTTAGRADHFDLLLEWSGVLLTWELTVQPLQGDGFCHARKLPDHRLHYLDYSGPLSADRGTVQQVAAGRLAWLCRPEEGAGLWSAALTLPPLQWQLALTAPTIACPDWVVEWKRLG